MIFLIKRLLWLEEEVARKSHVVSWDKVCQPKDCGGLGDTVDLHVNYREGWN